MKRMRAGVLGQLLMLFFCLLLPLALLSLLSLRQINGRLREEILESARTSSKDLAARLDNQLSNSQELAGTVLMHVRTNRLSNPKYRYEELYDWVSDVNYVRDLLSNIKWSNPLLSNVRVYLPLKRFAMNAANYPSGSVQAVSEAKCAELASLHSAGGGLTLSDGAYVLLQYSSLTSPNIISEIEISRRELFTYLHNNAFHSGSEFMLQLTNGGSVMRDTMRDTLAGEIRARADELSAASHIECGGFYVFATRLPYVGLVMYQAVPLETLLQPLQTSTMFYTLILCMIFGCVIAFFGGAYRLIHRPMHQLIGAFDRLRHGDFSVRVHADGARDFAYLHDGFNQMAENLEALIQQDYRQKLLLQKAELKQLQSQINPHFLYNSFFMLHRMINLEMQEESKEVAKLLGGYFQYITRTNSDTVTLTDEYEHALIYANIQRKRFEGRIEVAIEPLPEGARGLIVPKLILQPILENAYNYGMESKVRGGLLRMGFEEMEDHLRVTIEDNGETLTEDRLSSIQSAIENCGYGNAEEATGLINILRRLQIYYDQPRVMAAGRSELGGFVVSIDLFYEKRE